MDDSATSFGHPGSALLPAQSWDRVCGQLRLSPRELQIVKGVFEDHKEDCIASDLGISPHTVNTYIQRVYAKLRVSSRAQLIVRVVAEYLNFTPDAAGAGRIQN